MFLSFRSITTLMIPAGLLLASGGCSSLGKNKCETCGSNQVYMAPAPQYDQQPGGYPAPPNPLAPIPVPPATFPETTVPPPPTGEAARPSTIQRMQGSTTAFFLNANERVRSTFRR